MVWTFLLLAGLPWSVQQQPADAPVRVFLDCVTNCYADYLREEVTFVSYVRDRTQADVHVIVTSTETGSGGREYTAEFVGVGPFLGVTQSLKAVTTTSDAEDTIRRQLANLMRVGLLYFVGRRGIPQTLEVAVDSKQPGTRASPGRDPWNSWVFSLRGSASFEGEESSKQTQVFASASADRITPDWKLTFGFSLDNETEQFDLDEDEPVEVERREQEFDWLVVKALGEHWSAGAEGGIESSTFDNTELYLRAAPALEFNVFPYSAYTRRQLRSLYAAGIKYGRYYETTIFGEDEEARPFHELSVTYEQRERWGSLEGQVEWSQFLHDLSKYRLEANGEISLRIAQGDRKSVV